MGALRLTVQPAMRFACLILVVSIASVAMQAQSLEISLSPKSLTGAQFESGPARELALGAFRFEAAVTPVQIDGLVLTLSGSGHFAKYLTDDTGLRLWLDDGDGEFRASRDTLLVSSKATEPRTTFEFDVPLIIQPGEAEIWVVASFKAAGTNAPVRVYVVESASVGDVFAPGTAVTLGAPVPVTGEVILTPGHSGEGEYDGWCSASTARNKRWLAFVLLACYGVYLRLRPRWGVL
jgi:hypothetical protein